MGAPFVGISGRYTATLSAIKRLKELFKLNIADWGTLKIPPTTKILTLRNNYIPLSKRSFIREILQDPGLVESCHEEKFENLALFLDEKIKSQYQNMSKELSLLFQHILSAKGRSLTGQVNENQKAHPDCSRASQRKELDEEYWFLQKLTDVVPLAGFSEVSRDALQEASLPHTSKHSRIKTYVNPADYEVLRVWTRGLHPCSMYPIERSLMADPNSVPTSLGMSRTRQLLQRALFYSLPRKPAVVSRQDLCYGHVFIAFRTKASNRLQLKMLKRVPVSRFAASNLYAAGLLDLLPEQHFIGLSSLHRAVVAVSVLITGLSLGLFTPLAYLLAVQPEMVLAWSFALSGSATTMACYCCLRHWKARADWTERLRRLSLSSDFNSGGFALAHILGLAESELFKSALLAYCLLQQSSMHHQSLNAGQLEIRAETWIAKRLHPGQHMSLPSVNQLSSKPPPFTGGSGPLFDLSFESQPALQLLRQLKLLSGPDDGLEAPTFASLNLPPQRDRSRLWQLDPTSEEDDLGSQCTLIRD